MNKKEFLELLDRYLAGKASSEEEELLFKVYESFQDKQEWNPDELEAINLLEDKIFEKIKLAISQPAGHSDLSRVKHLLIQKLMIAASVAIFLTIGFKYFFVKHPEKPGLSYTETKRPVLKNDFKAGGNKAFLILSNGKKVQLNSAKIGVLAQQGNNAVIKKSDGQIVYSNNNMGSSSESLIPSNKIVVPVGGQYRVVLPDGTNVWINSSSSLEYPIQFAGKERKVKLTGEAYFEVAKNKDMPFIVDVNNKMNVKVLGTHFNIMAYDDENKVSTALLEGSVKIENFLNPSNNTYLTPGQQADLLNNGKLNVVNADVDEVIAWKEGRFLFDNEDIHSIMRKLSRWYNVDVVFSANMKNKNFDGSISRYKNISEVLKLMELTNSVHFMFEGRRITVMP